jgi:hypothetical protein
MLVELFRQHDDGPIVIDLNEREREFMKATSAATVLLYIICHAAQFDPERAKRGLAAMELNSKIDDICEM